MLGNVPLPGEWLPCVLVAMVYYRPDTGTIPNDQLTVSKHLRKL